MRVFLFAVLIGLAGCQEKAATTTAADANARAAVSAASQLSDRLDDVDSAIRQMKSDIETAQEDARQARLEAQAAQAEAAAATAEAAAAAQQ